MIHSFIIPHFTYMSFISQERGYLRNITNMYLNCFWVGKPTTKEVAFGLKVSKVKAIKTPNLILNPSSQ